MNFSNSSLNRGERSLTLLPQLATEISWRLRKPAFARAASAVDWSAAKSFTARKNTRQEEKSVSQELGERGAVHRQRGEDVLRLLTKVVVHDSGRRTDFARARVRRARDGAETWTSLPILNGRLTCSKRRRGRDDSRNRSSPSRRRGRFVFVVAARGWWTRHTATRDATERRERASSARAPGPGPPPQPSSSVSRRRPFPVESERFSSRPRRRHGDRRARVPPPARFTARVDLPELSAAIEAESGATLTEFPSALVAHAVDQSRLAGNRAFASGLHREAARLYTQAIAGAPDDRALHANRSAANLPSATSIAALRDAARRVAIDPNWPKAHYRLSAARR